PPDRHRQGALLSRAQLGRTLRVRRRRGAACARAARARDVRQADAAESQARRRGDGAGSGARRVAPHGSAAAVGVRSAPDAKTDRTVARRGAVTARAAGGGAMSPEGSLDVALVAMPWTFADLPAAALSVLSAYVRRERPQYAIECHSEFVDVSVMVGERL